MKTCFKCGRSLPIDDFYTHPMMADGHLGKCKECAKADAKRRYYDKHDEVLEYEHRRMDDPHRRAMQAEYAAKRDVAELRKTKAAWSKRNRHKKRAHLAVKRAIAAGRLSRLPCEVCGSSNSQGHHDDYSKPLDVVWLCPKHHGERHRRSRYRKQTTEKAA